MPTYITKLLNGVSISTECSDTTFCKDTSKFFNNLATKLLEMTAAINKRIEDMKVKMSTVCSRQSGIVLASVEAPKMTLGVRYEYIEYINRFGPPSDGVFEEEKLESLRIELGIVTDSSITL